MKMFYVLILCCMLMLCGCKSDNEYNKLKEEYDSLSANINHYEFKIDELESKNEKLEIKNGKLMYENNSINKELKSYKNNLEEETTIKTTVKKDEVKIIYPELPLEVSYISYDGLEVTCRIDKISYTYDSGTDNLRLYFTGEKIYDKNGTESLEQGRLYAALYDENGNIVEKNNVSLSKVKVNEKFYDCDSLFLEVPSGHSYTLKIYNRD